MKMLMLGWELPPHNSGGLGVACVNLTRALAAEGVEIDFVLPYKAEHPGIDFINIIPALPYDPLCRYGWSAYDSCNIETKILPTDKNMSAPAFISMREVQQRYCDFVQTYLSTHPRPDVIYAHDWLTFEAGILAKKNFGIPLICHVHATEYDRSGMNGGNHLVHEIEQEGLDLADKIVAVSDATRHLIHEKYHIPLEKIDIAYNALDYKFLNTNYHYEDDTLPLLEKFKEHGYTVVSTVGRFTIQKGLWHFMHAAKMALEKDPKLIFLFAGDGEERNELIAAAAEFGISENVIFTGFIRGQRLRDIYSVSDIFVMSSVSEPFGLTALEAAHHDTVLILTKSSGAAEVLPSALTYDFWDDNKLAEQIVAVSTSEDLKNTLKKRIAEEYRKISWEKAAKVCLRASRQAQKAIKNAVATTSPRPRRRR